MTTSQQNRKKGIKINPLFQIMQDRAQYLPEEDKYLFAVSQPKYRFNIIGTGMNGQEHIKITLLEGRATVHGVFDPNPGSIAAAERVFAQFSPQNELVIYESLIEACHDPAVDGLIISTPNYTHAEIVREAIKAGKHILLEKPMATTIHDAYAILQLANNYGAVFQVGLQYRFKANYAEAIYEALERKSVGTIKTIHILEHRFPFLDKVSQWNKFSRYSGGTLVEKCCHYFDLMNLFAQSKPVSVYASGSMAVNFVDFEYGGERSDILDSAFVTVTYENGVRGGFNLCMFAPLNYEELVLCGDEGRLKTSENMDFLPIPRPVTHLEILCGENQPARVSTPCYPAYIQQSGHNGSTYFEHKNFVDKIEGKQSNAASAEEGFWSIVIGVAAEKSIKTGQVISIQKLLDENGVRI